MGAGPSTIGQDMTYIGTIMRSTGPVEGVPVAAALKALTAARKAMTASGAISRSQERTRGPTGKEQITLRDFWAKRRRGIPIWTLTTFAIATAIRLSEITGLRWRAIIIRER
jgi:integrase